MRYQDQIIRSTRMALDDLFRTAKAVPPDKIEWKPLEEGRSVLDQLQECAQAPEFFRTVLEERACPPFDEEKWKQSLKERKEWDTIEKCEERAKVNTEKLLETIRNFPEEDLDVMVYFPFQGGLLRSVADIMGFHYWNLVYHTGQINYIQTLYGDKEMH